MGLFTSRKTAMIGADRALPGRVEPMEITARHLVLGTPVTPPFPEGMEQAMFGMGCFWGAERMFWTVPGVYTTAVGYAGGITPNPTYHEVCSGRTGHTEAELVVFDPAVTSYESLLSVFFEGHNPTQGMRQGNDVGTQYRSIILYSDEAQKRAAEKSKSEAARQFSSPIVTQIVPLTKFYSAEAYHQDYYNQHTHQTYCQFVIRPKLRKLIDEGVIPNGQK